MFENDLSPILTKANHKVFKKEIEEFKINQIDKIYEIVKNLKPEIIINCAARKG